VPLKIYQSSASLGAADFPRPSAAVDLAEPARRDQGVDQIIFADRDRQHHQAVAAATLVDPLAIGGGSCGGLGRHLTAFPNALFGCGLTLTP
jgi:hypothetical protein